MAAPAGMTLSESAALNRLTHLTTAIGLIAVDMDPKTRRDLAARVKALQLFVQAEERQMGKAVLDEITALFVDSEWAEAVERKVAYVRRIFRWEA